MLLGKAIAASKVKLIVRPVSLFNTYKMGFLTEYAMMT